MDASYWKFKCGKALKLVIAIKNLVCKLNFKSNFDDEINVAVFKTRGVWGKFAHPMWDDHNACLEMETNVYKFCFPSMLFTSRLMNSLYEETVCVVCFI